MINRRHVSFLLLLAYALTLHAASPTIINNFRPEDSDGDGLEDEMEFQLGTDPELDDTDADGWGDFVELILGTNPCDEDDHPRSADITLTTPSGVRRREAVRQSSGKALPGSRPVNTNTPDFQTLRYYQIPGPYPDVAAELKRSSLSAGHYLLIWSQQTGPNPSRIRQGYVVSIRRGDGHIIGEWQTPAEAEARWRTAAVPFSLTTEDQAHSLTFTVTPHGNDGLSYTLRDLAIVSADFEADFDRDGIIVVGERPTDGRTLRHWINDDDDSGEWQEKSDQPGLTGREADYWQPGVDGLRDIVDFIPLCLSVGDVIRRLPPSSGYRYVVSQDDQAVQLVPTSLTRATVGALHRNHSLSVFGPTLDGPCAEAEILRPDEKGDIVLPAAFLEQMMLKSHGILLMEGTRPSNRPLRLEVRQDDQILARLELPLSLVPVEEMYRHVDLTLEARSYAGEPLRPKSTPRRPMLSDPPGLPDAESGSSWVVMIHGYNVSAQSARAWHAETFKRLRALGGNARFIGVTWNGDTGLDYHAAVFQAFQSGDGLPRALGFVDQSKTMLVAHSLGNVVACQAIQSGFTPAHYILLNAALPIEAIVGESAVGTYAAEMTEASWRAYPRRLFAAEWSKLYGGRQPQHGCAWPNCFSRVRLLRDVTNCFSPGEDVTNCPPAITSASVLSTLWEGRAVDYGVWKTQELIKGVGWTRSLGALPMERSQGGWGFNTAWRGRFVPSGPERMLGGRHELLAPESASLITDAQLRANPFFRPFELRWLHVPAVTPGSPLLASPRVRYDLLARGLPALSPAAGGTPLPSVGGSGALTNLDLESQGRPANAGWPTQGHSSPLTRERWLHSDFKNVALPYVYPLYLMMVKRIELR